MEVRGLSSLLAVLKVTGRDREWRDVWVHGSKYILVHSQETKKVGLGTEYVAKHLAQSFSAWDLCNWGRGSADIFTRVSSSLRIELLCSYFDGNLNTAFLTVIKAAIIHNWKMFS